MITCRYIAASFLLITSSTLAQARLPQSPTLALTGVTIVDVRDGQLVPDQVVLIADRRIQAIGSPRDVPIPKGTQVIDAKKKYLIPGLWDMHIHVYNYPQIYFPLLLANGVTGIRDMGNAHLDSMLQWRREVMAGTRVGPRLVTSGPWLGTSQLAAMLGQGRTEEASIRTVDSPEEGRRAVDSLRAAGADFIKVRNDLPRDTYFAVAREARRLGIPFAGHLPASISVAEASDSGQHSLEHAQQANDVGVQSLDGLMRMGIGDCSASGANWMEEMLPDMDLPQREQLLVDWKAAADALAGTPVAQACAAVAAQLRRNDTWVTPTLTLGYDASVGARPERWRFWPETVVAAESVSQGQGLSPFPFQSVALAIRAGIPMLAGTDAVPHAPEATPGFALHDELHLLTAAGMTPLQALQAATLNPAKYFHATDSLGVVAVGKLADLVLLDDNPITDIANASKIRAVVANGRYFDRTALDGLLSDVQRAAGHTPRQP